MEEDKISRIFREYEPEISSSMAFMERLERNLNAVEMVHRENEAVMRRNRIAIAAAAFAGFISGMIFTLLLPYITEVIRSGFEYLTRINGLYINNSYPQVLSWIIIGAISVFIAVNTYDITLSLLPLKGGKPGDRHP